MTTVTIGNLTLLPTPQDTTVFAVEEDGLTKKLSAVALKSYMSTTTSINTSGPLIASGGITANSVVAATIGNVGATITGTIQTNAQPFITSLGNLAAITVTGPSLLTGTSTLANTTVNGTLSITGNVLLNGVSLAPTTGLVSFASINSTPIGNATPSTGAFTTLTTSGSITPTANLVYNLGSTTAWWKDIYGVSIQAKYADLAEKYTSVHDYSPGTVVAWVSDSDIDAEIIMAQEVHTPYVAGVISTNPAYLMNSTAPGLPVALSGRVPCKVMGPVSKRDRLAVVAPGTAGRLDPALYQPGCVIGYALESVPDGELTTIEVVIMRF